MAESGRSEKDEQPQSWKTPLAMICGLTAFAHEYGFWEPFHVAILEHVGLLDLPRLALWPLLSAAFGTVVITLASEFNFFGNKTAFPPGGGAETSTGKLYRRYRRLLGWSAIGSGVAAAFMSNTVLAVALAPVELALGTSILFDRDYKLPGSNFVINHQIAYYAVLILGLSYGNGVLESSRIIDGTSYISATFHEQSSDSLRYLRRVGEYVFFYEPKSRASELYKLDEIQPLKLTYISSPRAHISDVNRPGIIDYCAVGLAMIIPIFFIVGARIELKRISAERKSAK